jgi:hypothetical protein
VSNGSHASGSGAGKNPNSSSSGSAAMAMADRTDKLLDRLLPCASGGWI